MDQQSGSTSNGNEKASRKTLSLSRSLSHSHSNGISVGDIRTDNLAWTLTSPAFRRLHSPDGCPRGAAERPLSDQLGRAASTLSPCCKVGQREKVGEEWDKGVGD
jgi:hypothetical protein